MLLTTYTKTQLKEGLALGMPIALGYISVSFAFGMMAAGGNLPIWSSLLISMTNLTSAGQLAGTQLLIAGAPYIEIAMTTFVINIRYFLMSLSLSQKLRADTGILNGWEWQLGLRMKFLPWHLAGKRSRQRSWRGLSRCHIWDGHWEPWWGPQPAIYCPRHCGMLWESRFTGCFSQLSCRRAERAGPASPLC